MVQNIENLMETYSTDELRRIRYNNLLQHFISRQSEITQLIENINQVWGKMCLFFSKCDIFHYKGNVFEEKEAVSKVLLVSDGSSKVEGIGVKSVCLIDGEFYATIMSTDGVSIEYYIEGKREEKLDILTTENAIPTLEGFMNGLDDFFNEVYDILGVSDDRQGTNIVGHCVSEYDNKSDDIFDRSLLSGMCDRIVRLENVLKYMSESGINLWSFRRVRLGYIFNTNKIVYNIALGKQFVNVTFDGDIHFSGLKACNEKNKDIIFACMLEDLDGFEADVCSYIDKELCKLNLQ